MARRKLTGYIHTYSRKARDVIMEEAGKFLSKAGIREISSMLFSCVDELVKNAVKANYKFVLIADEIYEQLRINYPERDEADIRDEISGIIKVQESFDHLASDIISDGRISKEVREILNEESKYLNIRNKAYRENRRFTRDELQTIKRLKKFSSIKRKIKERDIKIVLKVQSDEDFIYIEVTNTAPILSRDLNRIHNKRDEYKKYRDEGREHEFFINNLDTSESGFGLGYATIDSIISGWGLDNYRCLTIISSIDTTVMLTIPISDIIENGN